MAILRERVSHLPYQDLESSKTIFWPILTWHTCVYARVMQKLHEILLVLLEAVSGAMQHERLRSHNIFAADVEAEDALLTGSASDVFGHSV